MTPESRQTTRSRTTITVVTLADEGFVLPLVVLVRSILDNLREGLEICLYIIDGGISEGARRALLESWPGERLTVNWIPPQFGTLSHLPVWGRIPPLTYARIFVPSCLPTDCSRAILLDADSLVLTNIGRLWDEPMDGFHVLAPRDAFVPFVSSPAGLARLEELGIDPQAAYFNAGAMLINVARWRDDDIPGLATSFLAERADDVRNHDQDALNAVLANKWREIDPRWQVQPRTLNLSASVTPHLDTGARDGMLRDPWLVHFSGRLKPWQYRGNSTFDRLFYEYLDRTAWKSWRPPRSAKAFAFRLYDGPLRRLVYPLERRLNDLLRRLKRHNPRAQ